MSNIETETVKITDEAIQEFLKEVKEWDDYLATLKFQTFEDMAEFAQMWMDACQASPLDKIVNMKYTAIARRFFPATLSYARSADASLTMIMDKIRDAAGGEFEDNVSETPKARLN